MTISEFLLARVAEDEASAREEAGLRERFRRQQHEDAMRGAIASWVISSFDIGPGDPARVLAECAAKRRIVEQFRHLGDHPDPSIVIEGDVLTHKEATGYVLGLRLAVHLLALPYADHPEYRQEWAV